MRIILARHGRPEIDLEELGKHWVTANEFGQVVDAYQQCDLMEGELPPTDLVMVASKCSVFLCSTLARSKSSCIALGLREVAEENSAFDEASMPYASWKKVWLPLRTWSVFFRIAWMFGFDRNAQHLRNVTERSNLAAQILIDQAEENGDVLLVGHGIINRLIGRQLGKQHWRMVSSDGDDYWSFTIFEDHLSAQYKAPLSL